MKRAKVGISIVALLALGLVLARGTSADGTVTVKPLHRDAQALERATFDAMRGFYNEDVDGARRGLEGMADQMRIPQREEREPLGPDVYSWGRASVETVNDARAKLNAGDVARAYDLYLFVAKACRDCHTRSRDQGLLRPSGDKAEP